MWFFSFDCIIPFTKSHRSNCHAPTAIWRKCSDPQKQTPEAKQARFSQEDTADSFVLQGEVNSEFLDWLQRSLICTSEEPRDLGTLTSALISGFGECTKVCSLSSHKFIVTLPSVARMEELLCNHEELDQWFVHIKKWDKSDFCESRRVWLEIFGVPPHGWIWENFHGIAKIWGSLVSLGKSIARTDSFNSMKVLIDTGILTSIEGDVILHLEDQGYRIKVKEVGPVFQVGQAPLVSSPSPSAEAMDSNNGVVGFEDLEDDVACGDNWDAVLGGEVVKETPEIQMELGGEVAKEPPEIQIVSNPAQVDEKTTDIQADSINSSARTKAACFSHNECSEDIINRHLLSLEVTKGRLQPHSDDLQTQGLENLVMAQTDFNATVPNAKQPFEEGVFQLQQQEEVLSQPPGFERPTRASREKKKNSNRLPRGSRQNAAKGHSSVVSSYSSDSLQKLAKEALHIGELLGLKVVQPERVTKTLKKNRISKSKKLEG